MNDGLTRCSHGNVATLEPAGDRSPTDWTRYPDNWRQPVSHSCPACKGEPCGIPFLSTPYGNVPK